MQGSRALSVPYRRGVPPGVYEHQTRVARTPEVQMDVAAFVGLAERGPLDVAVALRSFAEYVAWFGAPGGGRQLGQAVYLFFANGGRRCVVVRVADASAKASVWRVPALVRPPPALGATPPAAVLVARNPGAWGDRWTCTLRFVERPATLSSPAGVAWPRAAVTDPSVGVGATVRRTWKAPALDASSGELRDHLFEEHGTVAAIERGRGGARIATIAGLADPGAEIGLVTEVRLDLELRVGDQLRERFVDLGLAPAHPRHVMAVLRGDEAKGLGAGSRLAIFAGEPAPLTPAPGLLLAGRTEHVLVQDDEATGGDIVARGTDAAAVTRREAFFTRSAARDATPFELLDEHDEANETEPVSLVALPDLVHVRSVDAIAQGEDAAPDALRFDVCGPRQSVNASAPALEYPLLAAGYQLFSAPPGGRSARDFQRELVSLCEAAELRRGLGHATGWGRIAVLDLPPGLASADIVRWRSEVTSDRGCAALYAPCFRAAPAEDPRAPLAVVPPCGAVAGIFARAERARGFYVAPANEDVRGVTSLHQDGLLPDAGFLHEARVNVVRATERGLVLLGSRTTSEDPEWTHLSVRRLLHWLERQLAIDTRWAVFEPNDARLWGRLAQAVERRLGGLLRAGALAGRAAQDSYFVRCDASLNGRAKDAGRVLIEVGVAPSVPAEFIVFELAQLVDGTRLLEERRG